MIGFLATGSGIPIAHYMFSGNTSDRTTLPHVIADYQRRFAIGRIALVADRGLISEKNLDEVRGAGFDHVLATRLHRDRDTAAVLETSLGQSWVSVTANTTAAEVLHTGQRYVIALSQRVRRGTPCDPAKIGAAAGRILRDSGVGRCFTTSIAQGVFSWDHDADVLDYEERLLSGRYVITTSLTHEQASTAMVVRHYKMLQSVERRFRVTKDFLALRPVFHRTESRVRSHIVLCVIAATIEAVMAEDPARRGHGP